MPNSGSVAGDAEWGLLIGLPQSVLIAASVATPDSETEREFRDDLATALAG